MLARPNRLVNDKDFDRVFKQGRSASDGVLVVKAVRAVAGQLECNRYGIIISSKVSKKAVIRNKLKRRLRAIIRKNYSGFKIGFDVAIVALPRALDKSFEELANSLEVNFKRLRLLS